MPASKSITPKLDDESHLGFAYPDLADLTERVILDPQH